MSAPGRLGDGERVLEADPELGGAGRRPGCPARRCCRAGTPRPARPRGTSPPAGPRTARCGWCSASSPARPGSSERRRRCPAAGAPPPSGRRDAASTEQRRTRAEDQATGYESHDGPPYAGANRVRYERSTAGPAALSASDRGLPRVDPTLRGGPAGAPHRSGGPGPRPSGGNRSSGSCPWGVPRSSSCFSRREPRGPPPCPPRLSHRAEHRLERQLGRADQLRVPAQRAGLDPGAARRPG